jgi:N6-L-threonylcarbamoyladenine synthase
LCASFQKTVTEVLIENTLKALEQIDANTVVLGGGVSANSYIREQFLKLENQGIKVYTPDIKLCTDNAAMVASAGYYNFVSGKTNELDLNAVPNLKL